MGAHLPDRGDGLGRIGELHRGDRTETGTHLGDLVEVYLDGGERSDALASTIVDCTKADPVLLRRGGITPEQLREQLVALKKEAFNLRFQQATGQLESTARMRAVRRDVARVKTVMNQKAASAAATN